MRGMTNQIPAMATISARGTGSTNRQAREWRKRDAEGCAPLAGFVCDIARSPSAPRSPAGCVQSAKKLEWAELIRADQHGVNASGVRRRCYCGRRRDIVPLAARRVERLQ